MYKLLLDCGEQTVELFQALRDLKSMDFQGISETPATPASVCCKIVMNAMETVDKHPASAGIQPGLLLGARAREIIKMIQN